MYPSFSIAFASLQLFAAVMASPVPEGVGAGGECTAPEIKVSSVNKVKLGPFLVTGATTVANPNGGAASFSSSYSVSDTVSWGGSVGPSLSGDVTKLLNLALAISPSFSVSTTTGTSTSVNTNCPPNTDPKNSVTWGLMQYVYNYETKGTKTYYGYNPLMRLCNQDEISHPNGGTFDFDVSLPAKQAGSSDDADKEVEFVCCTVSGGVSGSPYCPSYT